MPYDKYRNWSLSPTQPCFHEIKDQVLEDLASTTDQTDKLEILDSFEVWVERRYTKELAKDMANKLLIALSGVVAAALESQIPYPTPMSRSRVARNQ